jgi:hypothetical protein
LIKSSPTGVYARLAQTAAIFIITSILSLLILAKATPIVWEDHFQIGQNLRSTGALIVDDVPSIFRPRGFPGFVAAWLWVGDAISGARDIAAPRSAGRDLRTIISAQAILLGVMATVLFYWASLRGGPIVAAGLAIAAALNPYSLALADVATYHLLFVVLASLSTLALALYDQQVPADRSRLCAAADRAGEHASRRRVGAEHRLRHGCACLGHIRVGGVNR